MSTQENKKCKPLLTSVSKYNYSKQTFSDGIFRKCVFVYFWLCHTTCGILVLQPEIEPGPMAARHHWTTREVPVV